MNLRHKLMRPNALSETHRSNEQTSAKCITKSLLATRFILTLFALCISVSAQEGDSCKLPLVKLGFTASMCSHNPYTISLNGTQVSGTGDCTAEQWVTSPLTYAQVKVDETYTLTVGSDSCSTHINFVVPDGYKLEIDGVEAKSIDKVGTTEGGGDGSWNVVLRKKCPCGSEGPGESTGPQRGSVLWEVGMGSLSDGTTAHSINLREEALSAIVYTPAALIYSPPGLTNEVDVVRNGDQSLRQVKAPQALADIIVISPTEYEIRYYSATDVGTKSGGLYPITGSPFVTWKIKNPDPSSTTRLQISKIQGATTDTSEYTWDAISDSWTLSTGNGARIETSTITYPTPTSRVETIVIKDNSSGGVSSKISKTYHTYAWGEELIQELLDPDGAALRTVYSYYENQSETGRYTRLKSIINSDGSWEKYDYDTGGNMVLVLRPWKDQSIGAATEDNSYAIRYSYSNSDGISTSLYTNLVSSEIEKIGGVIIRKRTYSRTGATVDGHPAVVERETSYSSATESLVTTSTRYHSTAPRSLANRIVSIEHPDGRKESLYYEKGNYTSNADPALSTFTPDANGLAERETMVNGTIVSPLGISFKTTKETSIRDQFGNQVLEESYVYTGTGYERIAWTAIDYDDRGHVNLTRNHKGELTTAVWTGDQKTSETEASGIETTYTYDSLNRIKTETKKGVAAGGGFPAQPDIVTTFSYDADGHQTSEVVTGGSLSLTTSHVFDKVGRLTRETDHAGLSTTYVYANGGRTQTVRRPGGATEVTEKYLDGQTKSVTGSAVIARAFDYGVNADGTRFTQEFVGSAGLNSPRWTKTTVDWIGRNITAERPSFTGTNVIQTSFYNSLGQLQKETNTADTTKLIADKLYEYDEMGQRIRTGSDIDNSGTLTLLSTDRLTETDSIFEKIGTDWFRVTFTRTYRTDNNDLPMTQLQRERLNNFPLNGTEQTVFDLTVTDVTGNNTRSTATIERVAKKQTTTIDTANSNINSLSISVNGLLQSSTSTTPQSATSYTYDSLGRRTSITAPGAGTSTLSYSATTGQLTSTNDGAGTTNFEYYPATSTNAGRLKAQSNAAGKKVYFNYNSRGEMVQTWGDETYPLEYVYNAYGQLTELHTFRGGQNWSAGVWLASTTGTADITKWIYQESTGLVTQKQDAALKGPTYTYDELGRIKIRIWARGVTCTYGYDANTGELRTITYSNSTPTVSYAYDRGGRQTNITDAAGAHTRTFNVAGNLLTEQITGGILDGVGVNVGYDSFLRRNSLQTTHGANTLSSQTYGYDPTSRLQTITSGSQTATYAYHTNSGLLSTTSFTGGTSIARTYDSIGRLENITTTPAADAAQSYTYIYNNLSQRTRVTREDGSYWSYIYNDRGELVSGKKYWSDNSIVWGAQTEYSFDNIGNREFAKNGGDNLGSLRQSNYTTNSLNQYSQRSVPGAVDLTGTANAAATVTVNNQGTARKTDYFYKELTVDNSSTPAYSQINVVGARNNFGAGGEDAVTQKGGRAFIPQTPEVFTYDDDGNLTSDGRWNYTWDGENRLISVEAIATVPIEAKQRIEFAYDSIGRRIRKKVYGWDVPSATYQPQSTRRFIYDGWSIIAELDDNNSLVQGYTWGGAELLLVSAAGSVNQVGYDGNQNVCLLVNAGTGTVSALYEYDPYGQTLRSTGPYANQTPVRFSSAYTDIETGLIYYGYRYLNTQTGSWLNRDPSEEEGGVNLYGFIGNDGVNATDHLGLWKAPDQWQGQWSKYYGTAIAECKDTLYKLAELITGDRRDRRVLKESDRIQVGQKVDIAPLLNVLERKVRFSVVAATKGFTIKEFAPASRSGGAGEDEINSYYGGAISNADCTDAAAIVQAKGLIDVLKKGEFNALGFTFMNFPEVARTGPPQDMWLGDRGFIKNYADYRRKTVILYGRAGPYIGENIIKVGPGRYWGLVTNPNERVKSYQGWESKLITEYTSLPGPPVFDSGFGFSYDIRFIDIAWVAQEVFHLRQK